MICNSVSKREHPPVYVPLWYRKLSYYVHKGSNVYGLMLDASKAFYRLNYCKLFDILMKRGVCPTICRLLLYMYTDQSITVRWNSSTSRHFTVTNGVKQDGVISPILFCVYIQYTPKKTLLRLNIVHLYAQQFYLRFEHSAREITAASCMLQLNIAQCVIGASWFYLVRVFLTIQEVLCVPSYR